MPISAPQDTQAKTTQAVAIPVTIALIEKNEFRLCAGDSLRIDLREYFVTLRVDGYLLAVENHLGIGKAARADCMHLVGTADSDLT
jgi:hypothetical protein